MGINPRCRKERGRSGEDMDRSEGLNERKPSQQDIKGRTSVLNKIDQAEWNKSKMGWAKGSFRRLNVNGRVVRLCEHGGSGVGVSVGPDREVDQRPATDRATTTTSSMCGTSNHHARTGAKRCRGCRVRNVRVQEQGFFLVVGSEKTARWARQTKGSPAKQQKERVQIERSWLEVETEALASVEMGRVPIAESRIVGGGRMKGTKKKLDPLQEWPKIRQSWTTTAPKQALMWLADTYQGREERWRGFEAQVEMSPTRR